MPDNINLQICTTATTIPRINHHRHSILLIYWRTKNVVPMGVSWYEIVSLSTRTTTKTRITMDTNAWENGEDNLILLRGISLKPCGMYYCTPHDNHHYDDDVCNSSYSVKGQQDSDWDSTSLRCHIKELYFFTF